MTPMLNGDCPVGAGFKPAPNEAVFHEMMCLTCNDLTIVLDPRYFLEIGYRCWLAQQCFSEEALLAKPAVAPNGMLIRTGRPTGRLYGKRALGSGFLNATHFKSGDSLSL